MNTCFKAFIYILLGIQVLLGTSCRQDTHTSSLDLGARYIWSAPDSAYRILQHIDNPQSLSEANRSRYALLMTQAMYRNNYPITSDSLINVAADYYSRHNDVENQSLSYLYKGYVLENLGKDEEAMTMFKQAEESVKNVFDQRIHFLIYAAIGNLYSRYALYENALCYYQLASGLNLSTPAWKDPGTNQLFIPAFTVAITPEQQPRYYETINILQEKYAKRISLMDFASQEKFYYQLVQEMIAEKRWQQAASFLLQTMEHTATAESRYKYDAELANIYVKLNKPELTDSLRAEALQSSRPLTKAGVYKDMCLEEQPKDINTKTQEYMQLYINELELLFTADNRNKLLEIGKKYEYLSLVHKNQDLHSRWSLTILITVAILSVLSLLYWGSWKFFRKQRLEMLKHYKKEATTLQQHIDILQESIEESQGENQNLQEQLADLEEEKRNKDMRIRQLEVTFRSKSIKLPIEKIEAAQVYLQIISKPNPSYEPASDRSQLENWLNFFRRNWADRLAVRCPSLTNGEKDMCYLFAIGLSFYEVASILKVQPRSVERTVYRICRKAGLPQSGKEEFMNMIMEMDRTPE